MKCLVCPLGKPYRVSNTVAKNLEKGKGYRYIDRQEYKKLSTKETANNKSVEEKKNG